MSVRALAVDGVGNVHASGNFAAGTSIIGKIAKWNGSNWSALEPGLNGTISVLVVDSAGDLYVPAFNGIAKWDGVSWSTAISGVSTVNVLAFDGAGNLFAGGGFTTAGGVAALRIAKWDGNNWSALGSGMDNRVSALVVDSMDNLYAGGSFTAVGDIRANFIAKWNGISWSALASGRNNSVTAMAIDSGDNLYAADFTITGVGNLNTVVFKVAKWDGSSWSTLGSGMDGDIKALAVDSAGELYAGGSFNTADGTVASRIARWNGSNWSALGSGMNSSVSALAFDSVGNLYAGGDFTAAGGIGANRIAKWDGNSWSAVGTGMNNPVRALVFDRAGMLYAGGDFTVAGGVGASRVAKWNGSSWSALGSGISNGSVFALTFDNAGNLYVGGAFSLAGGVSTKEIAKWDGSNWSRFGSGMNIGVLALAFDSTGKLYAGGDFTTAGRKVSGFVAYANLSDNTPPTLTLNGPNPLTLECPGQYVGSGAVVSDDTDPNPTLTISGTVDAHTLGNYTITYTATDASGNTATATRTVMMVDSTPPVITVIGASPLTVECHSSFTDSGATAVDACAGSVPISVSGSVNVNVPGSYTITYFATDGNGNPATASRTVTVADTTPPVITVIGASPLTIECHSSVTDPGATAVDACAGSVPISASGSIDVNVPGSYTITYSATDGNGNLATASRTVTLVDTTPPTITCPANQTVNATSPAGAVVTFEEPSVSDNCSVASVTCSPVSGSTFAVGTTTVTCIATDGSGNTATCSLTVKVKSAAEQVGDLSALVQSMLIETGIQNALYVKLQNALTSNIAGKQSAACGALKAFLNEVNAQAGKKLTQAQASQLTGEGTRIKALLGC